MDGVLFLFAYEINKLLKLRGIFNVFKTKVTPLLVGGHELFFFVCIYDKNYVTYEKLIIIIDESLKTFSTHSFHLNIC